MAFIIPLLKKDYLLYSKRVVPFKATLSESDLSDRYQSAKKTSARKKWLRRKRNNSDSRHVHFGAFETITYTVCEDDDEADVPNEEFYEYSRPNTNSASIPVPGSASEPLDSSPASSPSTWSTGSPLSSPSSLNSLRAAWKMPVHSSLKN